MGMVQGAWEWYFVIFYAYCYGFTCFRLAGYSLMAIGTSYLLGIRTPENFRKPFLSVDIQEFGIVGTSPCLTGSGTFFFPVYDSVYPEKAV